MRQPPALTILERYGERFAFSATPTHSFHRELAYAGLAFLAGLIGTVLNLGEPWPMLFALAWVALLILGTLSMIAKRARFEVFFDFEVRTLQVLDVKGLTAPMVWESAFDDLCLVPSGAGGLTLEWRDGSVQPVSLQLPDGEDAVAFRGRVQASGLMATTSPDSDSE